MALHQYIGARYVPTYYQNSLDPTSTEWEPNVNYEALTVVTLPNQHSYISKKSVPDTIGSPALNAEYWLDTGSDNAYIQALSDRLDTSLTDFAPLFDSSSSYNIGDMVIYEDVLYVFTAAHSGAWNAANVAQVDLSSLVSDLKTQINTIDAKVAGIKKRKILVIGNSYIGRGVADLTAACFDEEYHIGGDGSGFLTYASHPTTFVDQLSSAITNPNIPHEEITDILFVSAMGDTRAANERGATTFMTDLATAFAQIVSIVSSNFPSVIRTVVTLAESRAVPYFSNNKLSDLFLVHRTFKHICRLNGHMDYIGWSGFSALYNSACFESDNYHPNTQRGVFVIGSWMRNAYFGNAEYRVMHGSLSNVPIKYAADSKILFVYDITPDEVSLEIRRLDSTNNAAITLNAGDNNIINWTGINDAIPAPNTDIYLYTPVYGVLIASGMGYGTQLDFLKLIVSGDSNGLFNINNIENPMASTAKQRCVIDQLVHIKYVP